MPYGAEEVTHRLCLLQVGLAKIWSVGVGCGVGNFDIWGNGLCKLWSCFICAHMLLVQRWGEAVINFVQLCRWFYVVVVMSVVAYRMVVACILLLLSHVIASQHVYPRAAVRIIANKQVLSSWTSCKGVEEEDLKSTGGCYWWAPAPCFKLHGHWLIYDVIIKVLNCFFQISVVSVWLVLSQW